MNVGIDRDVLEGIFVSCAFYWIVLAVISYRLLRKVNGLSVAGALGCVLIFTGLSATTLLYPVEGLRMGRTEPWFISRSGGNDTSTTLLIVLRLLFVGALPFVGIPFLGMLGQKWLGSRLTEGEKLPGAAGVQEWLRASNLLWAAVIVIGLWLWLDANPLTMSALMLVVLAAYPVLGWATSGESEATIPDLPGEPSEPLVPGESLRDERDQVLRMVAENKITAEDGAQLLSALAATVPSVPSEPANTFKFPGMQAGRKMALVGAVIVAVGLFLPWFSMDLVSEVKKLMPNATMMGNLDVPKFIVEHNGNSTMFTQRVAGADTGWGWAILALCAVAAVLPFVAPGLARQLRRNLEIGAIAVASLLVIYFLTRSIQHVQYGLIIVVCGVLLEIAGIAREWRGKFLPRHTAA